MGGRILASPIEMASHPFNSAALPRSLWYKISVKLSKRGSWNISKKSRNLWNFQTWKFHPTSLHTIDNYQHIKDIWLIVILLYDCCIKIFLISTFYNIILFTLYCDIICFLSDVILKIKTMDGFMDGWMDGWMNECSCHWVKCSVYLSGMWSRSQTEDSIAVL